MYQTTFWGAGNETTPELTKGNCHFYIANAIPFPVPNPEPNPDQLKIEVPWVRRSSVQLTSDGFRAFFKGIPVDKVTGEMGTWGQCGD